MPKERRRKLLNAAARSISGVGGGRKVLRSRRRIGTREEEGEGESRTRREYFTATTPYYTHSATFSSLHPFFGQKCLIINSRKSHPLLPLAHIPLLLQKKRERQDVETAAPIHLRSSLPSAFFFYFPPPQQEGPIPCDTVRTGRERGEGGSSSSLRLSTLAIWRSVGLTP